MTKLKFRLFALSLWTAFCLVLAACQLSGDIGLVEYLEQNWDITSEEMRLARPQALIETATNGEYEDVVTGKVYDTRTGEQVRYGFKLIPPSTTVGGNVSGITDVSMKYKIWWCDTTEENPKFVVQEQGDAAYPWSGTSTSTVKHSLKTGLYYVEAVASADGFLDCETTAWSFGVGKVADVILSIDVQLGNIPLTVSALPCFFTTTTFAGEHNFELKIETRDGSALGEISNLKVYINDIGTKSPDFICNESSRTSDSITYTCTLPSELEFAPKNKSPYDMVVSFACGDVSVNLVHIDIYVFGTN